MPSDEKPVDNGASKAGVERVGPGEDGAVGSAVSSPRGLRSQPIALRILLFASLTALVVGVVRCSIEMTAVAPPMSRIGVDRALIDLDEDTAWAPADSLSARAARMFAEALREASSVDVRLASPRASGFDAIARLRIDDADGGIRVAVGIVDASSGRPLFETGGECAPELLRGLLDGAAMRVATALGIARDGGAPGEQATGESEGA